MARRLHNRQNRKELKEKFATAQEPRTVLSFYRYVLLENPERFRNELYITLDELNVKGRIYIAKEGINGQISVPQKDLERLKNQFQNIEALRDIRLNFAVEHQAGSFFALIIKVKSKIVADGIKDPAFDVTRSGVHLDAEAFNRLALNPESVIVDMRNHYESEVGHFRKAILPPVVTFRESLPIVKDLLEDKKDVPVIMYCTGGIRCEKASAYLKHHGFKEVYQLEGGIIKYSHEAAAKGLPNLFVGKNFVFDERLGERISEEVIARCHQCGNPCDDHTNCANDACHILFIQCKSCAAKYHGCCSQKCNDFIQLSPEEQKLRRRTEVFNGSKFSKGRYLKGERSEPV